MSTSTILPVTQPIEGDLHPESMAHLHQTLVDVREAIEGYLDEAGESLRPVLLEFRDMHQSHDRGIAMHMARHGHDPDESRGFMSLLSSGKLRMHDWFSGDHDDTIKRLIEGEHRVIERYNETLDKGQPADVIELLTRQREELARLTDHHDPTVRNA